MLKRKIEQQLLTWKQTPNHKPLIIKGCRQCGKTFSVRKFCEENYENTVYINFFNNPNYSAIFRNSLEVDDIIMMMSALMGNNTVFVPYKTAIIFDEIQDCPEARTALKFFHLDGRYDVIGTGSLLGVSGYGKAPKSVPVGYETVITMYPLDFEEFLWSNGISENLIDRLKKHLQDKTPVEEPLHSRYHQLLLQYVVVGGMPDVVQTFIDTKQMNIVLQLQRDIVRSYEDEYSLIKKGSTAARFAGSLQWIEDAGIIKRCYNLTTTELPLDGNAINDIFKVYMIDTGLFVSMLEDGTQFDILSGNLLGYKGAIFENLAADFFSKMGRKLYYFHKDSGLEIDFFIRYKGKCIPVEIKAEQGNTKSLKTVMKNKDIYHIDYAIKLGNYNVGEENNILTLPLYMGFLLSEY